MTEANHPEASSTQELLRIVADAVVRTSFERCCVHGNEFFDDFYGTLSDAAPDVSKMFVGVDMEQQNRLIRVGIEHLIQFASGSAESASELTRLGRSHGRSGLDIRPALYSHWIESLVMTVRRYDPEWTEDVGRAWELVLDPGIARIIACY